jgi:hypothetical protein
MSLRPILCLLAFIAISTAPSAKCVDLIAWNGDQVDLLNTSTNTPPSSTATGVNAASSGVLMDGLITDHIGNSIEYVGGYLQFSITADAGYNLQITDFKMTTNGVSASVLTILYSSATEGGSYLELVSLADLSIGPNTWTLPLADTIPAGSTRFYRLISASAIFTYAQSELAVFSFQGSATAVPEPSSYILAMAAVGTMGLAARRKKSLKLG